MNNINNKKVIGCLGKKIGMTQIITESKKVVAVTAVYVGENRVCQIKKKDACGYKSTQLAFEECREKVLNKPQLGHLKKNNILTPYRHLKEIREMDLDLNSNSPLDISLFHLTKIKISGIIKGKGFSGSIKRHGFKIGNRSHGAGYPHRQTGSICNGRGTGQKVIKGKKMPGQMGNKKRTKITIVERIDTEKNIIFLRGSVPGPKRGIVVLRQIF